MRSRCLYLSVLAALAASLCAAQQATATGALVGRSGKPLAKARVMLGAVSGDQEVVYARLKFLSVASTTDDKGRFQLKGFAPGTYTVVYTTGGGPSVLPVEISIKPLLAITKSTMPLFRGVEIGGGQAYPERLWGRRFTLLKGHTFYSEGEYMKIWNATARFGPQGPYLEIRKGVIWQGRLNDKSDIKLEAWSF